MIPLRSLIQRRLRQVVVDRGLDYAQVAQRCGLHPRTVERFLEGETFSVDTADVLCAGLRVELSDRAEEVLLEGLQLWQVRGARGWWARLVDVAEHAGVGEDALRLRVGRAVAHGPLLPEDVRRGVRDGHAIRTSCSDCLTRSPRGVTMLSARASLWCLLTAESERGEQAVGTLIEEGLRRLREAGVRR